MNFGCCWCIKLSYWFNSTRFNNILLLVILQTQYFIARIPINDPEFFFTTPYRLCNVAAHIMENSGFTIYYLLYPMLVIALTQ